MDRETAKLMLIDYLNGHLSAGERRSIDELLETDDDFRAEADALRREIGMLRKAIADPFEETRLSSVSFNVMQALRRKEQSILGRFSSVWRSYLRAAASVAVLLAGFLLVFFFSSEPAKENLPDEIAEISEEAEVSGIEEAVASEPVVSEEEGPRIVRVALSTDDPKVNIYWTFSDDFELN